MSDRVKGFVVALDQEMSLEEAAAIAQAISGLRGVAGVLHAWASPDDAIHYARARADIVGKVLGALR